MPLSSSVPCALRQPRSYQIDANAPDAGVWDRDVRIADVQVCPRAIALPDKDFRHNAYRR